MIWTFLFVLSGFFLQACCPLVFPSFSIRNILSFLHCPSHCISYTLKYLSFHLKSLLDWFSHRACSLSLLILVALLVSLDPVGNEKPKLQTVFKVFSFSLSSLFYCGVGFFVVLSLLVRFGEFVSLSWYLCIITVDYFIIP